MIALIFAILAATPIFAAPLQQEQVEAPAQQQSNQNAEPNPTPYYQVYSSAVQVPVETSTLIAPVSDSVRYYIPALRSVAQQTYVNQYPYQYSTVYPLYSYFAKAAPVEYVQDNYYSVPNVLYYVPQSYYTRIQQQQVQPVQKTQQQQQQAQNVQKSQQQQYQTQNAQKSQQQQYQEQNVLKTQQEPCQAQNVQNIQQEQYQVRNLQKTQQQQHQVQGVQEHQYQVQNLEKAQKDQPVQPQEVVETSQQQSVVQVQQQVSEKKVQTTPQQTAFQGNQ